MIASFIAPIVALCVAITPPSTASWIASAAPEASAPATPPTAASEPTAPVTAPAPGTIEPNWPARTQPTTPESNADAWARVEQVEAPAPAPAPLAPPAAAPPPPAQPQPAPRTSGTGPLVGGIVLMSTGAASIVFIGGIAGLVKIVALGNAKNPNGLISSREDRYDRARRADNAMEAGFWFGLTAMGVGVVLVAVGATMKSKARRAALARHVGPGAGGMVIRF